MLLLSSKMLPKIAKKYYTSCVEKVKMFGGCGIKGPWPTFKTEMLIDQSKSNLRCEDLFS